MHGFGYVLTSKSQRELLVSVTYLPGTKKGFLLRTSVPIVTIGLVAAITQVSTTHKSRPAKPGFQRIDLSRKP